MTVPGLKIGISTLPRLHHPQGGTDLISLWEGDIEIMAEGPAWESPREAVRVWAEALKGHPGSRSLHGPVWDVNLATGRYPGLRARSLLIYRDYLEFAAQLGAGYLVAHTHICSAPVFNRSESQKLAAEALSALTFQGTRFGVKVAVENVGYGNSCLFNEEEFCSLFKEIPGIVALLDVGHAHLNGWDIPGVIRKLDRSLGAMHLHDNRGLLDDHLPLGDGLISWTPIFRAIEDLPSPPGLTLEYDTPFANRILQDARSFGDQGLVLERGAAD